MDFKLSEEQRLLVDTIRSFIRRELQPLEQKVEDGAKPGDAVDQRQAAAVLRNAFARVRESMATATKSTP